jgi:hypothetical protein
MKNVSDFVKEKSDAYSVTCCFVYPRSAQIVVAGLDPAIHENAVIANLSN